MEELEQQVIGLGHAWRIHNALRPQFPLNMEMTLDHLIFMDQKLSCEQSAAVNHFSNILTMMTMLGKWKEFIRSRINWCSVDTREAYRDMMAFINRTKTTLGLPDEILLRGGYTVFNAEEGNYGFNDEEECLFLHDPGVHIDSILNTNGTWFLDRMRTLMHGGGF